MSNITIVFRDGTKREFLHEGRAGGSYTKSVSYKDGFVVVEDEWGKRTAFPESLVQEVIEKPERGGW